jgi:hypothetical protein
MKPRLPAVPAEHAELARKFYRRCQELFGDNCTVTVRHKQTTASTDAARQVPRGQHLTQPGT